MNVEARAALETALGYRFRRSEHLDLALRHRSAIPGEPNNEKLEFLGDAVLALAMSDLLMTAFPQAREGDLSKIRASLVNAEVLARRARQLDAGRWLLLGKGGLYGNVIRVAPPLSIKAAQVDEILKTMDEAFTDLRKEFP